MSNSTSEAKAGAESGQLMSAMFASLVIQNANMAMIFLGQAPHPQTGKTSQDLDHARYFIDQLEMLEVKTKGNLDKQEAALLNQSLTNLRLAFVEAVEHPLAAPQSAAPAGPPTDEQETPVAEPPPSGGPSQPPPAPPATESHKKFSKKY
jgi:K+-sensing histidine kinase KdpD